MASLAALAALGPTRVNILQTTEGRATGAEIPAEQSDFGPQTEKAEELFDVARGRARLTVHTADGLVKTTVVQGKERTTLTRLPLPDSDLVSVDRYISLQAPEGLPLPLWAGNAVGPTEGYPDLFADGDGGAGTLPPEVAVEQQPDGGAKLSWEHTSKGVTSAMNLFLDPDRLPVRIELAGRGTPEEGDLQGIAIEYSMTIQYQYERVPSFSDADFALDIPADAYWEQVSYELALDRPWSEQADWGQYWLGSQVEEWRLTRAEYAIHEEPPGAGSGAEPGDEAVFLFYDRPAAITPTENIQVIVRPLRGRYFQDSLTFAEQRVALGEWVRLETTLAGRRATVYSGGLEGGAEAPVDSIYAFLLDAFVDIQVWAPVDPRLVLEALSPVK
ncbi:MAG: hypothetical protein LLG45_02450 [Actinomycetia bacterium]|nr:hypothetical protein [Actinomycetes bacterium]